MSFGIRMSFGARFTVKASKRRSLIMFAKLERQNKCGETEHEKVIQVGKTHLPQVTPFHRLWILEYIYIPESELNIVIHYFPYLDWKSNVTNFLKFLLLRIPCYNGLHTRTLSQNKPFLLQLDLIREFITAIGKVTKMLSYTEFFPLSLEPERQDTLQRTQTQSNQWACYLLG